MTRARACSRIDMRMFASLIGWVSLIRITTSLSPAEAWGEVKFSILHKFTRFFCSNSLLLRKK